MTGNIEMLRRLWLRKRSRNAGDGKGGVKPIGGAFTEIGGGKLNFTYIPPTRKTAKTLYLKYARARGATRLHFAGDLYRMYSKFAEKKRLENRSE